MKVIFANDLRTQSEIFIVNIENLKMAMSAIKKSLKDVEKIKVFP